MSIKTSIIFCTISCRLGYIKFKKAHRVRDSGHHTRVLGHSCIQCCSQCVINHPEPETQTQPSTFKKTVRLYNHRASEQWFVRKSFCEPRSPVDVDGPLLFTIFCFLLYTTRIRNVSEEARIYLRKLFGANLKLLWRINLKLICLIKVYQQWAIRRPHRLPPPQLHQLVNLEWVTSM